MDESHSPWDVIERLEMHCGDVSFPPRWRAFVLACGNAVLPGLPLEAREWAEAAAKFDRGEQTADELAVLSSAAWAFHQSRAETDPVACAVRATGAMTGLGVGFDANRWYEGVWHFLNCCEAAGIPHESLYQLLQQHFRPLIP